MRHRRDRKAPAKDRRADAAQRLTGQYGHTVRVWDAVSGAALEKTKADLALLKRKGRVGGLKITAGRTLGLTDPATGVFLRKICPLTDG